MPNHETQLVAAFDNCIRRKASKEQLQAFVDRCRKQWQGNAAMLAVVESLQAKI